MLDTCMVLLMAIDDDLLDENVAEILYDNENTLCVSAETGRELVVGFNNHKFEFKKWKTSNDVIRYVENDLGIQILPIDKNVIETYSNLELNTAQDHRDPSDHIIIAHAMTAKIPLISSDRKFPFYTKQGLQLIMNSK
ncbi:MAG: type II toxin-antitoxin system VapC family toxin [Paludibacteraceae bacterium]|nr:type II toxin-antitoxin system VapC family toxin [Paludibacteraceae bacterium]